MARASKSTAVAVKETTAVALPKDVLAELAAAAKDEAAKEQPTTAQFSLRAGILAYDGTPVPDNTLAAIVLASAEVNEYYDTKFDPDTPRSPVCFAIGAEDNEELAPHENSLHPQAETCAECPFSQWGSDPGGGKGKACKQTRRLTLMPEDGLNEDNLAKVQLANLRLPVTSVRNWSNYVHRLAASMKRPPWAVVTEITVRPNAKTQFQVDFEAIEALDDAELLAELKDNRQRAIQLATVPFAKAEELEEETKPAKRAGKRKY